MANTAYGPSSELLSFNANGFNETRSYNANVELTELVSGTNVHYKYNYSGTQDNGQILSQTDAISGEVISYQYDTLRRLVKAGGTGDPSGSWSQSYSFDGFGNLSQVTGTNAPALSVAINTAKNQITTNAGYDNNGNLQVYAGDAYFYDIENRLVQSHQTSGLIDYGYDTANRRVYQGLYNGSSYSGEEIYFYGVEGNLYGKWLVNPASGVLLQASVLKQWFGKRLVSPQDRLDSRGKYYPFGQDRAGTTPANPPNDQEKFASYTRDSFTGLDYAKQRYYYSIVGRFLQPDPFGGSAHPYAPQSWNRYGYVANDPANSFDPSGLDESDGVFEYGDIGPDGGSIGDGGDSGGDADSGTPSVYTPPTDVTAPAPAPIPTVDSPVVASNTTFVDPSSGYLPGCGSSNEVCTDASTGVSYANPNVQGLQQDYSAELAVMGAIQAAAGLSTVGVAASQGPVLIGFEQSQAQMIETSLQALQAVGYDTNVFGELIYADMPAGYAGMSLENGAALSNEAFSSQAMLNHTLEEEYLHLQQQTMGLRESYGPGTAQLLENAVNASRQFPAPQ